MARVVHNTREDVETTLPSYYVSCEPHFGPELKAERNDCDFFRYSIDDWSLKRSAIRFFIHEEY